MKSFFKTLGLMLFAGILFTACEKDEYTITVNSDNNEWGTTIGSGTYADGTSVQIAARPNIGYEFVQWQDGNTENPRTITVTGDATYTATFKEAGSNPGGGGGEIPGGGRDIPDSNVVFKVVINGDSNIWTNGAVVFKRIQPSPDNSENYTYLQFQNNDADNTPIVALFIKDEVGTYTASDFAYNPAQYMTNPNDFVTVNGQQYPHYLAMDNYTAKVTAYDLSTNKISLVVDAELLDMQGEADGAPQTYIHMHIELGDFMLQNYNKSKFKLIASMF